MMIAHLSMCLLSLILVMWKRLKHGNITREKVPERLISSISSPALGSESSPEGSIPRLISADCDGEHGMKLPQSRADLIPPSHLTNRATSTAQFSGSNNFFTVFYGNVDFYVLFRFHHKLYERILASKVISSAKEQKGSKDHDPSGVYTSFIAALFNLLEGDRDNEKFEDHCRAVLGNEYVGHVDRSAGQTAAPESCC